MIYMMKHYCIYFMDMVLHKIYVAKIDYTLQKIYLPVFTPQSTIFGFIVAINKNYLLFNLLLLVFKYNTYNSRFNNNLNFRKTSGVIHI